MENEYKTKEEGTRTDYTLSSSRNSQWWEAQLALDGKMSQKELPTDVIMNRHIGCNKNY